MTFLARLTTTLFCWRVFINKTTECKAINHQLIIHQVKSLKWKSREELVSATMTKNVSPVVLIACSNQFIKRRFHIKSLFYDALQSVKKENKAKYKRNLS